MAVKIAVRFADHFYQRHQRELEKLDAHNDRHRSSAAGSSHNHSGMPSPVEEGEGRAQMNLMRYLTKQYSVS
jgi:hypothetical protein